MFVAAAVQRRVKRNTVEHPEAVRRVCPLCHLLLTWHHPQRGPARERAVSPKAAVYAAARQVRAPHSFDSALAACREAEVGRYLAKPRMRSTHALRAPPSPHARCHTFLVVPWATVGAKTPPRRGACVGVGNVPSASDALLARPATAQRVWTTLYKSHDSTASVLSLPVARLQPLVARCAGRGSAVQLAPLKCSLNRPMGNSLPVRSASSRRQSLPAMPPGLVPRGEIAQRRGAP